MFLESTWTWLAERWGNMADLAERVDDLICSFDSSGDTTMDTLSMLIFGWMLFGLIVLCIGKYIYNNFVLNEKFGSSSGSSVVAGGGHVGVSAAATSSSASPSAKDGHGYHGIGESVVSAGNIASKLLTQEKPIKVAMAKSLAASSGNLTSSSSPSVASHGGGGGPGIGYVPPTPPTRKRLTRKTSGPLVSPARSSRALHLPAATGADAEAVRWVNELVIWLHSDLVILNELLAVWVTSLNDFVAGSVDEV
ncbi:GSCOCG00000284001-RA-CDS, partial [Cotesia congregata]